MGKKRDHQKKERKSAMKEEKSPLRQINIRVWFLPAEEETDRPVLGYVWGDRWSLQIDAGASPAHVEKFRRALAQQGLAAPSLAVLITAIGVSYFLQNMALLIWGSAPKSFNSIVSFAPLRLFDGRLVISGETLVTIIVSAIIMVVLWLFVNKTKIGRAMLAVSEDRGAAQLMGVNVNATISITFAVGSALAAIAGALMCSAYPILQPTTGAMPGIKAFVAAVFGGIGSIPGAFLGGVLLGVIENLSKAYISTQLSDAIVFLVLIVVLVVKPTGLLGKKVNVKV